jgi:hypothetical protein
MVVELSLIATLFGHITNLVDLVMFKSSVGLEYSRFAAQIFLSRLGGRAVPTASISSSIALDHDDLGGAALQ